MAEFHRDLLFLLHDVARLLRVDADKRARLHGMTRAQWAILIRLDRQPGLSQKELSELLEVEPITVARLIDRLEARGMVERRPRPFAVHLRPRPVGIQITHGRIEIDLAGVRISGEAGAGRVARSEQEQERSQGCLHEAKEKRGRAHGRARNVRSLITIPQEIPCHNSVTNR